MADAHVGNGIVVTKFYIISYGLRKYFVYFNITFATGEKRFKVAHITQLEHYELVGKAAVLGLNASLQPAVFYPCRLV